ncbi:hypothetical protein GCM10009664_59600 [Kitasatospora gansuensis]
MTLNPLPHTWTGVYDLPTGGGEVCALPGVGVAAGWETGGRAGAEVPAGGGAFVTGVAGRETPAEGSAEAEAEGEAEAVAEAEGAADSPAEDDGLSSGWAEALLSGAAAARAGSRPESPGRTATTMPVMAAVAATPAATARMCFRRRCCSP